MLLWRAHSDNCVALSHAGEGTTRGVSVVASRRWTICRSWRRDDLWSVRRLVEHADGPGLAWIAVDVAFSLHGLEVPQDTVGRADAESQSDLSDGRREAELLLGRDEILNLLLPPCQPRWFDHGRVPFGSSGADGY